MDQKYQALIKRLQSNLFKSKKEIQQIKKTKNEHISNLSELETIFVDAVHEVKQNINKRRMSGLSRKGSLSKKGDKLEDKEQQANTEKAIYTLAKLKGNHLNFKELTAKDKSNILELFMTNEYVIIKLYELLFPQRVSCLTKIRDSINEQIVRYSATEGEFQGMAVGKENTSNDQGLVNYFTNITGTGNTNTNANTNTNKMSNLEKVGIRKDVLDKVRYKTISGGEALEEDIEDSNRSKSALDVFKNNQGRANVPRAKNMQSLNSHNYTHKESSSQIDTGGNATQYELESCSWDEHHTIGRKAGQLNIGGRITTSKIMEYRRPAKGGRYSGLKGDNHNIYRGTTNMLPPLNDFLKVDKKPKHVIQKRSKSCLQNSKDKDSLLESECLD